MVEFWVSHLLDCAILSYWGGGIFYFSTQCKTSFCRALPLNKESWSLDKSCKICNSFSKAISLFNPASFAPFNMTAYSESWFSNFFFNTAVPNWLASVCHKKFCENSGNHFQEAWLYSILLQTTCQKQWLTQNWFILSITYPLLAE